jgi:hypothetical protein
MAPIVREHIQAEVDRFQTRLHFQREFDLEPLMFNEALLLTISPEFAWKYTWDPALKIAFFLKE